jgi:germination protein M
MPMSGRIVSGLCLIALLPALAACGGGGDTTSTETTATTETTETTPPETTALRVYFLLDGKVQPVAREVPKTQAVAGAALGELLLGPTNTESELGLKTSFEAEWRVLAVDNGVASIEINEPYDQAGLAQVVYTLTQFPTVKAVEIGGKRYTRADFEDETPIILVESPLPYERVDNPLRAMGTANTFEATFQYEVVDPAGKIVDKNFVTATSGTGTRGTFDFRTRPFTSGPGTGALVVFEYSAKDGSRIHEVRIPVRMES